MSGGSSRKLKIFREYISISEFINSQIRNNIVIKRHGELPRNNVTLYIMMEIF
ncbi:hypothetical protein P186_1908 [Pyrobaculum ferrireducens]|uniref:Uncharacterized protein n=1 Tax=Pyrobaculum ferrireducens TaxID=1104324 RepID=G7VHL9_9CREN|nr:hypothetical protein P186_1908 [Pyrobaculum ferrireducens]